MRKLLAASLLAASAALPSAPAQADSPVSLPQLAPGEVLLEVSGMGIVRTPASSAVVVGTLHGYGTSEAEAQRALDAEIQRITAAARAAGAGTADITVDRVPAPRVGIEIFDVSAPPPPEADAAATPATRQHGAQATVRVRLRNAARARELHARLGSEDPVMSYGGPQYALDDEAPARREARSQALAAARADAESYAAAAGMRIVRMVRITERAGFDFAGMAFTERGAGDRIGPSWYRRGAEPVVETIAVVGVDYVLAPR